LKLLSIAIPCYNSENYIEKAVESLLHGGDQVEILIVDDGSTDKTAAIADDYEQRYPGIVRTIHKENGGHGDAVNTGLRMARGLYFKVVDSDDWVDPVAYPKMLHMLEQCLRQEDQIDMLIANYIYDKVGVKHKHVMSYHGVLPEDRVFSWEETRHFHVGKYLLMHSVIYRTQLLRDCGLQLPKHTFYVDNLYVYRPLPFVRRMRYLNVDFYHYFIGRADQSVCENVMIQRVDQLLSVNYMVLNSYDLGTIGNRQLLQYMKKYVEIVTIVSSIVLILSGSKENLRKKNELWTYIQQKDQRLYQWLRRRMMGRAIHLHGCIGRRFQLSVYRLCNRIFGFN